MALVKDFIDCRIIPARFPTGRGSLRSWIEWNPSPFLVEDFRINMRESVRSLPDDLESCLMTETRQERVKTDALVITVARAKYFDRPNRILYALLIDRIAMILDVMLAEMKNVSDFALEIMAWNVRTNAGCFISNGRVMGSVSNELSHDMERLPGSKFSR